MKYHNWVLITFILLSITGCSFQAHTPAPVSSISASAGPKYNKGSITTGTYKVKRGDTLYSISWGAGKDFSDIAKYNRLKAPYTIYPGQTLKLYQPTPSKTSAKPVAIANSKPKPAKKPVAKQTTATKQASTSADKNSTKKELDHKAKPAYSVKTTQEKTVQVAKNPVSRLPDKVSKWNWPNKGRIIGYFSTTQQGNQGIKLAGSRGDIIKAAADGRVVYAGNALRGYGNLVIIKHNEDFLSAYAHADAILVKEKQYVNAGQTVAKMGSTGANQVMLHFEIRLHGKSVNPLNYLPKR
ncbi:peptidase M23 [Shewanella sp. UCD-FRSSP16_17]|uniref:peptidoglycan DD-metalloendopeptidase family protein n=1 Tax=unclassified Shewanella TaxID=196818 RepID=UPI0007EED559|nr:MULTISPECIES: peptidoglycan DD-metalloendopeptidase family protein [unclassified Shewanella]MBQ4889942.1 peptidoglycan DD-metalloendopeptidase family protein [Shewanella sp. MMG014]OBT10480.1 peptidase M23 [Shewanella sp. UCD-FRSSP16_17]